MADTATSNTSKLIKKLTKKEQESFNALKKDVQNLPDQWVACRDMRHAWQVMTDFHVNDESGRGPEIRRELSCMRCETVRRESYENNKYGLDRVATTYIYPDKYQLHGLPQGINLSGLVRQDQYRRAMEKIAVSNRRT